MSQLLKEIRLRLVNMMNVSLWLSLSLLVNANGHLSLKQIFQQMLDFSDSSRFNFVPAENPEGRIRADTTRVVDEKSLILSAV